MIEWIYVVKLDGIVFIIINLGVFIYISIVLWDVFIGVGIFFIEVYIFNVYVCENFCKYFYLVDVVVGVIVGLGF